jgi:hypothetical protein
MLVIREASFQISREIALQGEVAHNATHPGAAKPSVLFANLCYVGRAGAGVCIPHCRGLPLVVRPRLRLAPGFTAILLVFTCQYDAVVFLGPSLLVGPLGVAIGACFHAFSPGVTETRRCLEWDFRWSGTPAVLAATVALPRAIRSAVIMLWRQLASARAAPLASCACLAPSESGAPTGFRLWVPFSTSSAVCSSDLAVL